MSGQVATDAKTANSAEAPRIAATALAAFIKRAFEAAGLRSEDAHVVADLMVEADLRGSDTHGVIRLPLYLRRLKAGRDQGACGYPHRTGAAGRRPRRRRQRHRPPRHALCRHDGDR